MNRRHALPSSWVACTLGAVIDYGVTQKVEPEGIPDDAWVLELEDIEKDTSRLLRRCTFAQRRSRSTKHRFMAGDVLYGKLRPYLNKVIRADRDGYCTTEILPLRPTSAVHADYLYFWLKHPAFLGYVSAVSHGLNMPRLGTEAGQRAPFVLAPHREQKRIAARLEALLARVDACRARLDRVPAILARFRQAVLAAATSGKLTEDWRASKGESAGVRPIVLNDDAEIAVPAAWKEHKLVDLIDPTRPLCYGVVQPGEESERGVPLIRVQDMECGRVLVNQLRTVSANVDHEYRRSRVKAGDLLVSVVGTIGRTALVPSGFTGNIARAVARIACTDLARSQWVDIWLRCDRLQWWLTNSAREVARKTLNLSQLEFTPIALPSKDEQTEIVRRVESLLACADRLEARYAAARAQVERLTPALLAKAFRGELVAQDPADEPAAALLERIRAERAAPALKPPRARAARPSR